MPKQSSLTSLQSQNSIIKDLIGSTTSLASASTEILSNPSTPALQKAFYTISESKWFNMILFVFIMLNTIVCLLETSDFRQRGGYYLDMFNPLLLGIFTFEMGTRFIGWRRHYFKNPFNCIDFALVILGFSRFFIDQYAYQIEEVRLFRTIDLLRMLRIGKVFRLFPNNKFVQSVQLILKTLGYSASSMMTILVLMLLTAYIYAVAAVYLLGEMDPEYYGTVAFSIRVMLQISSQDSWSSLYIRLKSYSRESIWFLGSYLVIQSLLILNLLTAVIVDNLTLLQNQTSKELKKSKSVEEKDPKLLKQQRQKKKIQTFDDSGIEQYYSADMPIKSQEIISTYYMNLAALEQNTTMFQRHQRLVDEMVELLKKQEK